VDEKPAVGVGWHRCRCHPGLWTLASSLADRWINHAEFRVETRTNLKNITARLENIEAQLLRVRAAEYPGRVLSEIVSLDQAAFTRALPALRRVAEQPVREVAPTAPVLVKVVGRLRQTPESAPEYWPSVLQFIRFASDGISPLAPDTGPVNLAIRSNMGLSLRSLVGQRILLEGGELVDTRFERCRIKFTEDAVRMRNVVFVDCAFEFPTSTAPGDYLRAAARLLLGSDLQTVRIAALG
jgi:hypothetical protein